MTEKSHTNKKRKGSKPSLETRNHISTPNLPLLIFHSFVQPNTVAQSRFYPDQEDKVLLNTEYALCANTLAEGSIEEKRLGVFLAFAILHELSHWKVSFNLNMNTQQLLAQKVFHKTDSNQVEDQVSPGRRQARSWGIPGDEAAGNGGGVGFYESSHV